MLNIASFLDFQSTMRPNDVAVIDASGSRTYSELCRLASRLAKGLQEMGVKRGEHVAISCPNRAEFIIAYFGVAKLGCVVVPINLMLLQRDISFQLRQTRASAFICWTGTPALPSGKEGAAAFQEAEECRHFIYLGDGLGQTDDTAYCSWDELLAMGTDDYDTVSMDPTEAAEVIYSSGTTGKPRGSINSVLSIVLNAHSVADCSRMQHCDRVLCIVPLFAGYARGALLLPTFLSGATLVLLGRYDRIEALSAILSQRISVFAGVPSMYWDFLECYQDLDIEGISTHLRLAFSAGAPLPIKIEAEFEKCFKVPVRQMLGMAEARIVACERADEPMRSGSVGRAVWGMDIRVVDDEFRTLQHGEKGEILVKGPSTMLGYKDDPESTSSAFHDSWLRTGDVGYLDHDNYLYVVDRNRDVINRNGYKIYPREIEDALSEHPSLALVSAIGIPDERAGEEVIAFVTLSPGHEHCSSSDLVDWARERLPRHVYPRRIEIRETLPKGPTGKILKQELREMALNI